MNKLLVISSLLASSVSCAMSKPISVLISPDVFEYADSQSIYKNLSLAVDKSNALLKESGVSLRRTIKSIDTLNNTPEIRPGNWRDFEYLSKWEMLPSEITDHRHDTYKVVVLATDNVPSFDCAATIGGVVFLRYTEFGLCANPLILMHELGHADGLDHVSQHGVVMSDKLNIGARLSSSTRTHYQNVIGRHKAVFGEFDEPEEYQYNHDLGYSVTSKGYDLQQKVLEVVVSTNAEQPVEAVASLIVPDLSNVLSADLNVASVRFRVPKGEGQTKLVFKDAPYRGSDFYHVSIVESKWVPRGDY